MVYKILSHALSHLSVTRAQGGSYYHPHLIDQETEAQRVPVIGQRSQGY